VPGTNVSLPPGVHVPPTSGEPPSLERRLKDASLLQTVMLALFPASGAVSTVTTTFAVAFAQGGVPFTVYT